MSDNFEAESLLVLPNPLAEFKFPLNSVSGVLFFSISPYRYVTSVLNTTDNVPIFVKLTLPTNVRVIVFPDHAKRAKQNERRHTTNGKANQLQYFLLVDVKNRKPLLCELRAVSDVFGDGEANVRRCRNNDYENRKEGRSNGGVATFRSFKPLFDDASTYLEYEEGNSSQTRCRFHHQHIHQEVRKLLWWYS